MLKVVTKQLGPSQWTAFIDGDMLPYPTRGETEQEALHKLKAKLARQLSEKEAECEEIWNAIHVLFPKPPRGKSDDQR